MDETFFIISDETNYYTTPLPEPKKFTKNFFDIFEPIIYALIAVAIITIFVARLTVVDGKSMETKLQHGSYIVVSDFMLSYKPKQGDIVVAHGDFEGEEFDKPIVKRVIATGGQTVRIEFDESNISNPCVYVDGKPMETPTAFYDNTYSYPFSSPLQQYEYFYLGYTTNGEKRKDFPEYENNQITYNYSTKVLECVVPEGSVFLMGDNRYNSADSRIPQIGCVPEKYILGKAILRLTPFSKFGGLYKD